MNVVVKEAGKFEHVYIMGAVLYFPRLMSPQKKYQSEDRQYSVVAFVDKGVRDKLELPQEDGGVFLNKQFYEVGVDKNKKKRIKYPTSDQNEENHFDDVKGMHGVSITAPEFKKNGDKTVVRVVDSEGGDWDKDKPIGTGTKANIRMWGYRNEDGQLNVTMDVVQIVEYVEGSGGGGFVDDVLGVTLGGEPSPENFVPDDDDIPF